MNRQHRVRANINRVRLSLQKKLAASHRSLEYLNMTYALEATGPDIPDKIISDCIDLLAGGREYRWYPISPIAKPRMTRSDKWKERPCVMSYRTFKDECRMRRVGVADCGSTVIFCLEMPRSWSAKKRRQYSGQFHMQRPDIDNLIKSLLDASRKEDSGVAGISAYKIWATIPGIAIIQPSIR